MSRADDIFIEMCRSIIENGYSTEGEKVRPKWEDGTSAYTIKKFGVVNRYDLSKEFPAITLRKTYIKSAIDEILWIWQKKSNNVHDLKSHIWDSWADEDGSIGKAYGYQMGVKHQYKEGMFGFEFSQNIGWLVGESTDYVDGENTGVLTKEEYDEFINNLVEANVNGTYLYSKPYYIYKGIKK